MVLARSPPATAFVPRQFLCLYAGRVSRASGPTPRGTHHMGRLGVSPGEGQERYYRLAFRDTDPLDSVFVTVADAIFLPTLRTAGGAVMERQPLNVCEAPLLGITLIEASAGTGKTQTITDLMSVSCWRQGVR